MPVDRYLRTGTFVFDALPPYEWQRARRCFIFWLVKTSPDLATESPHCDRTDYEYAIILDRIIDCRGLCGLPAAPCNPMSNITNRSLAAADDGCMSTRKRTIRSLPKSAHSNSARTPLSTKYDSAPPSIPHTLTRRVPA